MRHAAWLLLAAAACAQAEPVFYRIDPAATHVHFEVLHFGTSTARGRFDAIELRDRLAQAVEAQQPGFRCDVLPDEKEAHEIGWTDRRDLGAEAIQRVAMDAREQPSITPFQIAPACDR